LSASSNLVHVEGHDPKLHGPYAAEEGWVIDADDLLLIALLRDPVYGPELTWRDAANHEYAGCYRAMDYQYPLFRVEDNYAGFACARSVGKALADYMHVLTPSGYVRMDEIEVGDFAIGSDGKPTEVLGVYPQQGKRELYRVAFTDGTFVDCDGDHLWTVTCDSWEARGTGPKTLTLHDIRWRKARFKVPLPSGPVEFKPLAPPHIDPWAAGALLGDGNLTPRSMVRFASIDDENVARLQAALPEVDVVHDGGCNYRLRSSGPKPGPCEALTWSRLTGLAGRSSLRKFIPDEFLWGSVAVRTELLRGLVDTDGYVTHAGSIEVSTSSPQLAEDIRQLVLSLGGRCSIKMRHTTHADAYRVVFRIDGILPCHLTRKKTTYEALQDQRTRATEFRLIDSIRPIGPGMATCIEVNNTNGLFMTEDMVLTHNTESIKARAFAHVFKRVSENMLITAPELIHLLPLTEAIEDRILDTRISRDFLDTRGGKTGLTHRPFGAEFYDGTRLVGRIPKITGTGVKGQHEPDMVIDEAQDYPEKGWTEIHETVIKDHTDKEGNPDFTYHFFGVHSGDRDSGFFKSINDGAFKVITITAIQRPGWSKAEKDAAKARYGGTQNPDYRRNIYGEPGAAASAFFVTARLMACVDQGPPGKLPTDSDYNTLQYVKQQLRAEEVDELRLPMNEVLDLPDSYGKLYIGADLGLTNSPTVVSVFSHEKVKNVERLKLIRLYELHRFRTRQIRECFSTLGWHFGSAMQSFGIDITGLGFPIWQEMEDDENVPQRLRDVSRGYFFNAKVPVNVDKDHITKDEAGRMRDQYGASVEVETDEWGQERLVTKMPMIEASTRYLREFVDSGFLMLPFDKAITTDMQGETQQRVRAVGDKARKPNAFHILDSFRGMAMGFKAGEVEEALAVSKPAPVFDIAL